MRTIRRPATVAGFAAASVLGVAALSSAAVAAGFMEAPAGLRSADGTPTVENPSPDYPTNARGQSFGSSADASNPNDEPDLILVVATNGKQGYVRRDELHAADGSAVRSPSDAIAWQSQRRVARPAITVYAVDGQTVIGEFIIG